MKTLVIGNRERYEKYMPADLPFVKETEIVFCKWGTSDEEILAAAGDASFIAVDAMASVSGNLIRNMPNLKVIHSEGVGYQGVDVEEATKQGVYVCNCKGVNAGAVAEQAVLLMLALLRNVVVGDRVERKGGQIQMKERMMLEGIREVSDCKIGLIGFGDIAKATAERLYPFGCDMYYYSLHKKDEEIEKQYHVSYLSLEELASTCDIISIHAPANDNTKGMINEHFISLMKPDAFLVNTARGDLVDNEALRNALISGIIAGAGLDTITPEPTTKDNPLVALPAECADRVIYSPHIGGITTSTFRRAHHMLWQAFSDYSEGKKPANVVNRI